MKQRNPNRYVRALRHAQLFSLLFALICGVFAVVSSSSRGGIKEMVASHPSSAASDLTILIVLSLTGLLVFIGTTLVRWVFPPEL